MELMKARWMIRTLALLLVLAAGLTFPGAAAETQPNLQCNVTRRPDGSTLYRVSEPRGSNRCTTDWMHRNRTVIARTTSADQVMNATDTSFSLKGCEDFLLFERDCIEGFEEAHCSVNCSGLLVESQPLTVNSTLICVSASLCLQPLKFWIVIIIGIVIIAVAVSFGLCIWKRKRQEAAPNMVKYRAAVRKV